MTRFPKFQFNPPVSANILEQVVSTIMLPTDYVVFLKSSNGGQGFIGEEYLIFMRAEDLMRVNIEYRVDEFFPGIFLIGSNGGSEAIAIDHRAGDSEYILIPFLFEEDAIIGLGKTFENLLEKIERTGFFGE